MGLVKAPIRLAEVVKEAVDAVAPLYENKDLWLRTHVPESLPLIEADRTRVRQVLINLLNNATKFTPSGGTISVTVKLVKQTSVSQDSVAARELSRMGQPYALLTAIADTGIGISAEDQQRIFERFYKVDRARTRNSGGTGLGLAIAKHIVERHDGSIWVESEEGKGSTFTLLLPGL